MRVLAFLAVLAAGFLAGCASTTPGAPDLTHLPSISVVSAAYAEGGDIPARHTCTGDDVAPPLAFSDVPEDARFLAGVLEDPDATRGTWTHWTWWDLPANVTALPEHADLAALGAHEGLTTGKTVGYAGPCPRTGTHRYVLRVYATEDPLGLADGASIADVHDAIAFQAIAQGTLMGHYAKP